MVRCIVNIRIIISIIIIIIFSLLGYSGMLSKIIYIFHSFTDNDIKNLFISLFTSFITIAVPIGIAVYNLKMNYNNDYKKKLIDKRLNAYYQLQKLISFYRFRGLYHNENSPDRKLNYFPILVEAGVSEQLHHATMQVMVELSWFSKDLINEVSKLLVCSKQFSNDEFTRLSPINRIEVLSKEYDKVDDIIKEVNSLIARDINNLSDLDSWSSELISK